VETHNQDGYELYRPQLVVSLPEGLAKAGQQRGLLSLELRSGICLARLWADRGEADRALELLEPIFSRFSEGFQTRDLMAAAKLLAKLRSL
jgi:predicted ATPase